MRRVPSVETALTWDFSSVQDVLDRADLNDTGDSLVIALDAHSSLTLSGVTTLTAGDLILV